MSLIIFLLLLSFYSVGLLAQTNDNKNEISTNEKNKSYAKPFPYPKNHFTIFQGVLTPKDVSEIISTPPAVRAEFISGISFNRSLFSMFYNYVLVEAEAFWAYHYGQEGQYYGEYIGMVMLRLPGLTFNKYIHQTVAIGDGVSYTEEIFKYENRRDRRSSHWTNYLAIETAMHFLNTPYTIVLRLHHRSSAYGLILNGNTDSNFYCLGLRLSF